MRIPRLQHVATLYDARAIVGRALRAIYHRLPLPSGGRLRFKSLLYRSFSFFIKDTASYRHWLQERHPDGVSEREEDVSRIAPPHLLPALESGFVEAASDLTLPFDRDPEVTILMPVYNQAGFTLCCLQSIAAAPPRASIEIIVIDDASTDETPEMLRAVSGIRHVRNDVNQGFLLSCNRGAALARGRYLHILNNDTQVQAGWLDALLDVFVHEPDTGIAGSKLIYPSGHLQEAGAALKRNGSVELIGLNEDPSDPLYGWRRRVDHCSGASILIEASLFNSLGGFDEVYAPAYYEDCDLSLRVQAAGRHVVYEPSSVVVHHLSISTNARPAEKLTRIAANSAIFLDRWQSTLDDLDTVKLIAFFLPQFHPIPENDLWWGKGFTEWTNVTRAKPNFSGHRQPHLPSDLGFYDLRLAETRQAQADLARHYGIYGFCYYHYWFAGKRLLQRPIDEMLASGKPDFPFCICWANESWSRRWDGREADILIAQQHSETDDLAFIRHLQPFLRDHRYIRINGRPLILVYRIELFPDPMHTAEIWREYCVRSGLGEIYLACVQSFGLSSDPADFGFDAIVEFPPHDLSVPLETRPPLDNSAFSGQVYDYPATAERFMQRPLPDHRFFRTAMPSWDNTARRQDAGTIFLNSTPDLYEHWLSTLVTQSRRLNPPGERFVFVNAWNEWAEGNHLEPDQYYGHGYLEATRSALDDMAPPQLGSDPGATVAASSAASAHAQSVRSSAC
ncbi:glycoside hydrolase family 99-like domain-containing protein [Thiocapsa marina]|uniref:Glycosyl transferase family 2 n=1 Tax=Thiocapsa marina 5811 TaxID=768671 RepID=F9U9F1_9GAMM|nr:glycoside hydrolase family 99-like domain-containing protein [Thiocapsa marina]EGV19409.1 glycosyl transferase family 2 [Thiocapsa marina 5811]